jgi:hypothetical protein
MPEASQKHAGNALVFLSHFQISSAGGHQRTKANLGSTGPYRPRGNSGRLKMVC